VQVSRFKPKEQILEIARKEKVMRRRVFVSGLAGMVFTMSLFIGLRSAAAGVPQASPAPVEVKIDNFSFGSGTITVPVGTTVTWTNRDDIPHTVVSTEGVFKSKVLDTDEKFSYTFSKAGSFPYFCSVHPKMTGKVVVQ
jgi:plastocyanin